MDLQYHKKNNSDPRFEVIIGAILTQNTAWSNVEKALHNLKQEKKLDINNIASINEETLKTLIQPSGFFNQKAHRVKNIANHLKHKYQSNLDIFFNQQLSTLRNELLALHGIGQETADSILLYAGNKPIFVVDAYTKRLCIRLSFPLDHTSYHAIQTYFETNLKEKYSDDKCITIYNEYHALIVELAKRYCTKQKPKCSICPIQKNCSYQQK